MHCVVLYMIRRAELESAFMRVDEQGLGYVTQEQAMTVLK